MNIKNINPNKLHDELVSAGIIPISVKHDAPEGEHIAPNTWIELPPDTDMGKVQKIIDAHDPTLLPEPPTLEERLQMAEDTILFLLGGM